ncbi:hypothetical protein BKA69DRAFT_1077205 [Paraphysoderma sedebokerense]|nr:hypothetical protein BKA69DRAFT_1077205 [Paraphysoderma sedebokerense]
MNYLVRAKAIFDYKPNPNDPSEICLTKNEDILVYKSKTNWWLCKKLDGTMGIVPKNHCMVVDSEVVMRLLESGRYYKARALHDYTPNVKYTKEVSLVQNEIVFVEKNSAKNWWRCIKTDGSMGIVPRNILLLLNVHSTSNTLHLIGNPATHIDCC